MKKILLTATLSLGLWLCALPCPAATAPVQYMSALSLAAEYYGTLNGHYALYDFDSSALAAHLFRLHYSPAPWLRLTGGIGGGYAYASQCISGAKAGLALTGGAGLYTPRLFRRISLTAGYDYFYVTAKEKSETYKSRSVPRLDPITGAQVGFDTIRYVGSAKDGATSSFIHAPSAGLIFHLGRFADFEIGGVYHYFNISQKDRTVSVTEYDSSGAAVTTPYYKTISNDGEVTDQVRLYATLTLHERESGAFVVGGAGYALTNVVDNDKTILPNFSFWGQVGLIMRDPRDSGLRHGRRDASYVWLKVREERMAEALRFDTERNWPRRYGGKGTPPGTATESGDEDAAETETGDGAADAATTEE